MSGNLSLNAYLIHPSAADKSSITENLSALIRGAPKAELYKPLADPHPGEGEDLLFLIAPQGYPDVIL